MDSKRSHSTAPPENANVLKPVANPKRFRGTGHKAEMFDDGFLRLLVGEGLPDKVWCDDRDWRKVRPPPGENSGRFGMGVHNAHAGTSSLHGYYHDTSIITEPLKGTPWYAEGTEEWKRDTKMHYANRVHMDLSTQKGDQQADRLRQHRLRNMWTRVREVEDRCKTLNETRMTTYDARLAFMNSQRKRYNDNVAKEDAQVIARLQKNGRALVPLPSALEANGYPTMKCLQPGGLLADPDAMPKRIPGMKGPRGIFPTY